MTFMRFPYLLRVWAWRLRKTWNRLRRDLKRYQDRAHKRRLQKQTMIVNASNRWEAGLKRRY
jgi:hypothetical protein